MLFEELVSEVAERLNLTSDTARSRVGRSINARYKRITSSLGLQPSRRTTVTGTTTPSSDLITFDGITKVQGIYTTDAPPRPLAETTVVDLRQIGTVGSQPPSKWALYRTHATSVDVMLDCTASTSFDLTAEGYVALSTLSGSDVPDFPEDFHDVLIYGAMADEYKKQEKVQLYHDAESDYEKRLADLRFFIQKSNYLDIYQGKQHNTWPFRNGR